MNTAAVACETTLGYLTYIYSWNSRRRGKDIGVKKFSKLNKQWPQILQEAQL